VWLQCDFLQLHSEKQLLYFSAKANPHQRTFTLEETCNIKKRVMWTKIVGKTSCGQK
jgi:hypothetical protein